MLKTLIESRQDLQIFGKLIAQLSQYCEKTPIGLANALLNTVLDKGIKCIPKDKTAQEILNYLLTKSTSIASRMHELLNARFDDLPSNVKPLFVQESICSVAYWKIGEVINDKILSLILTDAKSQTQWTDSTGNKVEIINMKTMEEK